MPGTILPPTHSPDHSPSPLALHVAVQSRWSWQPSQPTSSVSRRHSMPLLSQVALAVEASLPMKKLSQPSSATALRSPCALWGRGVVVRVRDDDIVAVTWWQS